MNKKSYFQGTEEPTPKKKKYESEPRIVDQPRFVEPFYRNYDVYETEGVDGPAKHGPGAGWHDMGKYKSIKEFLAEKRKKLKDKYKADDSWVQDSGKLTKKDPKMQARASLLSRFVKIAIDFPIDDQINDPILGNSGTYSDSVPIGGQLDEYLTEPDFEGKSADQLDFGRDYAESEKTGPVNVDKLIEKYLNPKETDLYGLPDGIDPEEDLDADKTVNNSNPEYGTTDSGNTLYDKIIN
jgi:hypothetical protein